MTPCDMSHMSHVARASQGTGSVSPRKPMQASATLTRRKRSRFSIATGCRCRARATPAIRGCSPGRSALVGDPQHGADREGRRRRQRHRARGGDRGVGDHPVGAERGVVGVGDRGARRSRIARGAILATLADSAARGQDAYRMRAGSHAGVARHRYLDAGCRSSSRARPNSFSRNGPGA